MIYPTKLDFSTTAWQAYDFDDLTDIDSFTVDDKNVGKYIIGFWIATGGTYAEPGADIYKDGIKLSWKNVSKGFFSYIGPLEKGEYTISNKESFSRRGCMISKSIPEVAYYKDGASASASIPVVDSTGFNYIFIENFSIPGHGYFDPSYSDSYLGNFNVSIVKKDITSINGTGSATGPKYSLLKFSEGFGISYALKKGDILKINQTTTLSNFNNLKVKIELYGRKGKDTDSGKGGNGGYTSFILNSDKIETLTYMYRRVKIC